MSQFSPGRAVLIGSPAIGTGSPSEIAAGTQAQDNPVAQIGMWVNAELFYFDPVAASVARARTPSGPGKSGTGTASFTIWTPAAGKKFRVMWAIYCVASNSTMAAGTLANFGLFDAGAGAQVAGSMVQAFIPAAAGPVGPPLLLAMITFPGNGYLGGAANGQLQMTVPALTAGGCVASVFGTEE
jgi:hypothetical protein